MPQILQFISWEDGSTKILDLATTGFTNQEKEDSVNNNIIKKYPYEKVRGEWTFRTIGIDEIDYYKSLLVTLAQQPDYQD